MRRPLRFVSCAALALFTTTALATGSAYASGASGLSSAHASAIASHGLGAHRPTGRFVAPSAHFSALDVLPASVDLKQWTVTPGNQGQVSSCVTWAIDYAMLGWYSKYSGRAGQPFAPMYTYSQINGGVDAGSWPPAALEIAKTQGSDTRAHYTHGDYDWRTKPTAAEKANAANYKIKSYKTLFMGSGQATNSTLVKQAIATNHPVAITMAVRSGFDYLGSNPAAVDDDITSPVRGYHEVLAVGYDPAGIIIENSWSTGWANGGFGRLSWRVVQSDVWEADTIEGFVTPPPPPPPPPALTPPTVTAPTAAVQSVSGTGTSATIGYRVTWKGTAGTSGAITKYEAWLQTDGGTAVAVTLAPVTSTTFNLTARPGHTYRIAVRANAGTNAGAITYGTQFAVVAVKK
ncbi:MAG TPA: C1 family peptidase [Acidimicrobiia bacterium]|nr:C1 family peptidase [Acidimicrobiia bacterium]